ncbi:hypothetical protein Cgig2_020106 [Carnegiea gigantea]|uniref:Carbohydrate kinase PfkB domain-containing protein n=1 Tax=Carnegiea gigantea TaxID=171969 RepID=A0A9Q1QHR9_9CARY|nr:hypothetical protein Cgig2_020106 [Carnegiea gigantea]
MDQVNRMPIVVGGMVLDIHATASVPSSSKSTTPGKIEYMHGGVARNIAECLLKLGTKPYMISAVGYDMAGILRGRDLKTAVVCNMFDVDGELTAGVASVESIEQYVTPQWIQRFEPIVRSAPVMLVDANLSLEALSASCRTEFGVPVWFEPVSVAKSKRVASVTKHVTFASPNEHELVAMAEALTHGNVFGPIQWVQNKNSGSIESLFKELKPAILVLLDKSIKFVLVTLGPQGAILCSRLGPTSLNECLNGAKIIDARSELFEAVTGRCPTHRYTSSTLHKRGSHPFAMHFPALPATVGRVSGAGDCLVGGVLASLCSGLNIMQSVAVGIAAAKAAILVKTNVPHQYDLAALADDAGAVYNAARVVFQESQL